nr:MAG TPA: hypothetical protein [Caudoviricetes sp.]DAP51394.1 MAG TPA: hypothetical protein [Caudoviricetes sp.]
MLLLLLCPYNPYLDISISFLEVIFHHSIMLVDISKPLQDLIDS